MSKHRFYWYGFVRSMIGRYNRLDDSEQGKRYKDAIDSALADVVKTENGYLKEKAIRMVCIDRRYTTYGASEKLNYSNRTVQRWIVGFIKDVGHRVGF